VVRLLRRQFSINVSAPGAYFALRGVNLTVARGDKVAVIGNNGSGKTTFLKLVAGLYQPSEGEIHVTGEILLLRGVGTGMVEELSVRENVCLYGVIHGMDRGKIAENFDEILEWAELTEFAEAELRTLSSGMRARLAFSIARHFDTDIFLLDETFAVGDKDFRSRYEKVFRDRKSDKKHTYLIATHDLEFARLFCTKTLWLQKGRLMAFGETKWVLEQYLSPNRVGLAS
jgi:ABC-type polysaccharide/polyol phosphate transport system ATPase subunit